MGREVSVLVDLAWVVVAAAMAATEVTEATAVTMGIRMATEAAMASIMAEATTAVVMVRMVHIRY